MLNQNLTDPSLAHQIDCQSMDETTAVWFESLIRNHAHDINGRIMSLKLNLYLMEKQSLTPDLQRLVDRMKMEVNTLTQMVEQLQVGSQPCDV